MNLPAKILRPTFKVEKQFDYSVMISCLFRDIFGTAEYDDVPDKYKIAFDGIKKPDKKGKLVYTSEMNRWKRLTERRTKNTQYRPESTVKTHYKIMIDHPLLLDEIHAQYFVVASESDEYTSCSIGMINWSTLNRAWAYDGSHPEYARSALEYIITSYIAHEYKRRMSMKVIRKLL